jgi:hypothetical protein
LQISLSQKSSLGGAEVADTLQRFFPLAGVPRHGSPSAHVGRSILDTRIQVRKTRKQILDTRIRVLYTRIQVVLYTGIQVLDIRMQAFFWSDEAFKADNETMR